LRVQNTELLVHDSSTGSSDLVRRGSVVIVDRLLQRLIEAREVDRRLIMPLIVAKLAATFSTAHDRTNRK